MPNTKILIVLAFVAGCSGAGGTSGNTRPDAPAAQPDALEPIKDTSPTQPDTQPAFSTATSITTGTGTKADAGTTPDSLPPQIISDSSVPDAPVQVVKPDALPMAQDTLPQATPDAQLAQQPDALPMAVDTMPATPDAVVLVDTRPTTPDTLPAIDTMPATPDTLPATPDALVATDTTPVACGGVNQPCCIGAPYPPPTTANALKTVWIHTCGILGEGPYDCNIPTSTSSVDAGLSVSAAGPSGTCVLCGYAGTIGCRVLPASLLEDHDTYTVGTSPPVCIHDLIDNMWSDPICIGDVCLCPPQNTASCGQEIGESACYSSTQSPRCNFGTAKCNLIATGIQCICR